ncbi:sensor histidine kinase [Isoptericola sp. BMS4]|uniref:sensor histidine kinase n=1 Tax=Isoptericola sp. BMS4 TaxID=2527875 RepID=UPI00141E457D|nr:histidine kinase [Isoptericola sp. BMS4]
MRLLPLERIAADVLLGATVVAAGVWRDVLRGAGTDFLLPVSPEAAVAVHVASAVVLVVLRRRRPRVCALALGGLSVVVPSYAALVMPYSAARYGRRGAATVVCGLAAPAGWVVGADLWAGGDPVSGVLLAAATATAGLYARGRAEALECLEEQVVRTARTEDRRRVAADLHGAVTHHVTLAVMRAGVLAARAPDDAVRTEAEGVRAHGVHALRELGDMVAALSDPAPGAGVSTTRPPSWTRVVEEAVAAGQDVTSHQVGDALDPGDPVAGLVDDAVREALANARKHAAGAAVAVHLAVRAASVRLLVRDDGAAAGGRGPGTGAGTGLDRLRRAAAALGGRLEAAPTPEGGFEVDVRVPRTGEAS